MAQRFTPTRHVMLKLTSGEAEELVTMLEELTPDDVLAHLAADADARAALAITRITNRKLGQGTNKLTLYEGRVLTELLVAIGYHNKGVVSRLGVELARQGGAKVGRR